MADVHVLDFCPAIDQHGVRLVLQESMRGKGIEVLQRYIRKLEVSDIMEASLGKRKLPCPLVMEPA